MASVNKEQVERVAEYIKGLPDGGKGLDFYSSFKGGHDAEMYPELNHPQVLDFFFFYTMHNYGFWYGDHEGYVEPLSGRINGKDAKGSDLLTKAAKKAFDKDSLVFTPSRLAVIKPGEFFQMFSDDNGPIPFPDLEVRYQNTRAYGQFFEEFGQTPSLIVERANKRPDTLHDFLRQTSFIPGYDLDDLVKKNLLLAMALANRPENFLKIKETETWEPIVDYHLMRVSLRLGLVDLRKDQLQKNITRSWVDESEEENIRSRAYEAVSQLIDKSGKPMSVIDEKLWMARKYCPEMTEPDCGKCVFQDVCKQRTELFQPVYRTTAY